MLESGTTFVANLYLKNGFFEHACTVASLGQRVGFLVVQTAALVVLSEVCFTNHTCEVKVTTLPFVTLTTEQQSFSAV